MKRTRSYNTSKAIKYFFLISHGLPFLLTALFMIIGNSFFITNQLYASLIYLGFLSPTYAALFILYYFYNKEERRKFFLSVIDFKNISWKWYLFILFFPIGIRLLASLIDVGFTNNHFQFNISTNMSLIYAIVLLFFGPIPEEIGWRGVALPELQKKFSFNKAVMFLGFMWAIWHLPLFFIKDTYQNQMGIFTSMFWNFIFGVFFASVIYGIIYNKTKKSVFSVILFHYAGNLAGETFEITENAELITTILRGILAILILIHNFKKPLKERKAMGDNM